MEERDGSAVEALDASLDDPIGDDLLRLVFSACHPVLSTGLFRHGRDEWVRPALCEDALRLGRIVAELAPEEPRSTGSPR